MVSARYQHEYVCPLPLEPPVGLFLMKGLPVFRATPKAVASGSERASHPSVHLSGGRVGE